MAICKYCGRPLILSSGKCLYCGKAPNESSRPEDNKKVGGKSKQIVQRRTSVTNGGQSPYSQYAGQSIIPDAITDMFGNPQGSQYDLAKDGAFKGYKIVVVNFGMSPPFKNQNNPIMALNKKGFQVTVFEGSFPNEEIKKALDAKTQLWIIAGSTPLMNQENYSLVYDHFNKGRGLYIWSDNAPLFADSNIILSHMFGSRMSGEYYGDHVLTIQTGDKQPGIIKNHPITTGLQNFYEGITVSNVKLTQDLKPLVYSSDGLIVTAYFDKDGKRALIDGGFTRLYDSFWVRAAGTDRFVVNCAAWLTNIERFGYHPE